MINRGKTSRQQLKERCATLKRYMFYPEGTRRAGHADADEPGALKVGGLKNIYESGHAAHRPSERSLSFQQARVEQLIYCSLPRRHITSVKETDSALLSPCALFSSTGMTMIKLFSNLKVRHRSSVHPPRSPTVLDADPNENPFLRTNWNLQTQIRMQSHRMGWTCNTRLVGSAGFAAWRSDHSPP